MECDFSFGWKRDFFRITRWAFAYASGDHERNGVDSLIKESRAISPNDYRWDSIYPCRASVMASCIRVSSSTAISTHPAFESMGLRASRAMFN